MPTHFNSVLVICPFYVDQDSKSITCEGATPRTQVVTKFRSQGDKCAYEERCCNTYEGHKKCILGSACYRKYEQMEREEEEHRLKAVKEKRSAV